MAHSGWNIYGELLRAQAEILSADPSAGLPGRFLFNSTTKKFRGDNGTSIIPLGGTEQATPLIWRLQSNAPTEGDPTAIAGLDTLDFDYLSSQEVWSHVRVPSDYLAGVQILLKGGLFGTTAVTNKVKFKATTYLIRPATTVIGTFSNSQASTNAEVTVSGTPSTITAVGNIDLTDTSGQINSVAVAALDVLLIKLIRDSSNESASAAADARLLRFSMVPIFS